MKTPNKAQCIVYNLVENEDFTTSDAETFLKRVPPQPPRGLLQSKINDYELHLNKEFKAASVHTNPQGETFCFGKFGSGKNSTVVTLLWFNHKDGEWDTAHAAKIRGLKEAMDPDDPETVLRTHPGFEYRSTMYTGDQVFVKGVEAGEEMDTDWPWQIGSVVQGPENLWYVIDIHGLPQEDLGQYGLGLHDGARTFDERDQAATALWTVWRRLPEHPLKRLRRRRKMRESISDKEIQRYLSGVKPRPGLKRYSTAQLIRFLRRRQPAPPEPPGEPHRIVPQQEGQSIEQRLIKASKKITHCGDYGTLYYHPGKRAVHWNMADSDGAPDYTSSDEIRKLLSLPGITHVELGDEWSPREEEGWKRLA